MSICHVRRRTFAQEPHIVGRSVVTKYGAIVKQAHAVGGRRRPFGSWEEHGC